MLEAGDLVVLAGEDAGAVERARGGGVERVDREARLARARDAGDAGEGAKRDGRGDVSQVVRGGAAHGELLARALRSEEHTSELQSLMRNSYAVFCLKKKKHLRAKLSTIRTT